MNHLVSFFGSFGRHYSSTDRRSSVAFRHKLLAKGLSQRQAAIMLYAVSALFAAMRLLLLNHGGKSMTHALVIVGTIVWIALQRLG